MRKVKVGITLLLVLLLLSLLFMDKGSVDSSQRLLGPGFTHFFGCDSLGRDLFGRVFYASFVSISLGLIVSFSSIISATLFALLSFKNEKVRRTVMSVVGAFKSIPTILVGLLFASFFGGSFLSVSMALIISSVASNLRVMETKVKETQGEDYIMALDALGLRKKRVLFVHVLPSLFSLAMEEWATVMMSSILSESALSFLGIGIDRSIPTLGSILSEGRNIFFTHPHLVLFPSLALLLIGTLIMIIKTGLSELDPSSH